jgi:hypothetical protein
MIRACDQLNTHGMARRSVILSPALRDGGRLPMLRVGLLGVLPQPLEVQQRRLERGGDQRLEVAPGQVR